jgi:hypothetical protein
VETKNEADVLGLSLPHFLLLLVATVSSCDSFSCILSFYLKQQIHKKKEVMEFVSRTVQMLPMSFLEQPHHSSSKKQ